MVSKPIMLGSLGMMALIAVGVLYPLSPATLYAHGDASAKARLRDTAGNRVGEVKLTTPEGGPTLVHIKVHDLPPGFHGFHVHAVGKCEPPFTSAGGHFNPTEQSHPDHVADLPVLLVNADGTGQMQVVTDRFEIAELFDADGSAIIIHANPDNYANIPERYGTPDEATLATGDAGDRIACGVIE